MKIQLIDQDFELAYRAYNKNPRTNKAQCCPIAQAFYRIKPEPTLTPNDIQICDNDSMKVGDAQFTGDDSITEFINWFDSQWNEKDLSELIATAPYKEFELERVEVEEEEEDYEYDDGYSY